MKIIITGSLGYIGSVLTGYLEKAGHTCVGYDTGFFTDCLLYPPSASQVHFKDARDLNEEDLVGADAVVHLAGIANDPMGNLDVGKIYDPTRAYALHLAKICKNQGIKFIFASSCSVYGKSEGQLVNEDSPLFPQTPYSLNKVQVEEDLKSLSDNTFSPIALRLATVFGLSPRIRFDTVTNMFTGMAVTDRKIILNSDGTPWRPIVHVLDVCRAIQCSIDFDYQGSELLVLNVGDETNNLQVIDIAKVVSDIVPNCELGSLVNDASLDKEGLIRDRKVKGGVDSRSYRVSFEKIRKILPGFSSEWSVEQGVQEMSDFFEKLPLTREIFKQKGFYRLQELEYLYENKYLSDELRWLKTR